MHTAEAEQVRCAVVTLSDTRDEASDRSGALIRQLLAEHGREVSRYQLIKDDAQVLGELLQLLCERADVDVVIINGSTGIARRDIAYEVLRGGILEKFLPGFGERFRHLSWEEIGAHAMASRACAGVRRGKLLFSIPGSSGAVRLAMRALILPELGHLVHELRK